jgi:hypothetical protein
MIAMAVKGYLKTQLVQIIQHLIIGLGLIITITTILLS